MARKAQNDELDASNLITMKVIFRPSYIWPNNGKLCLFADRFINCFAGSVYWPIHSAQHTVHFGRFVINHGEHRIWFHGICAINGFGVLIAILLNRLWSCPQKSARRLDLDEAIESDSGQNGTERTIEPTTHWI